MLFTCSLRLFWLEKSLENPSVHNVHFSKCYVTVRPACLAGSRANATWIFFFLPSISAETSWSKLFVLVSHDSSKYPQLWSIPISICRSLPFCDTFFPKNELSFLNVGRIHCYSHRVLLYNLRYFIFFYSNHRLKFKLELKNLVVQLLFVFVLKSIKCSDGILHFIK